MTEEQYLTTWLRWHRQYETMAFKVMKKAIIETASRIPLDNLNYTNYKLVIPLNIQSTKIEQAYFDIYETIGLIHGNRIGRGINRDIKNFLKPLFNAVFQNSIIDWVRENCGLRIVSVTNTISKTLISLVEKALADNLTVEQMQKFIRERINVGLSRYEVLRIVRTETTSAANHAALVSGETSGIVLVKQWVSTKDSRTRRKPKDEWSHIAMNGVKVEQNEKFIMVSTKGEVNEIDYPCGPGSSASNCINCRCSVALVPKRDSDGFVVRR